MRNTKLHTICILALGSILTIGFEANAQLDPNMEAAVDCSVAECMFRGNSQPHDAIAGFQRLPSNGGEARMFKINRYADNGDQFLNRKTDTQFNAIGQLETINPIRNSKGQEGTGVATAFLVSPCYVLTNHHAVFGDDFPSVPSSAQEEASIASSYSMKFSVGAGTSLPFAGKVTATPVVWGDRDGANRNDWALMKLSSCVGKRAEIGWMDLDLNQSMSALAGHSVSVASYPNDRGDAEGKFVGKGLRLAYGKVTGFNRDNGTVRYSASTAPGSSGGIVMVTAADGSTKVIGMHRGGKRRLADPENSSFPTYSDEYANEFLNIADIIGSKNVRELLTKDRLDFGQPNPNGQNLRRAVPARSTRDII